jgi:hypothetical protein
MSSQQYVRATGFGTMEREAKRKLRNDNDCKILVVGANSQTGIGKTTFAVQLCRKLDGTNEGWSADEKAFVDVGDYVQSHLESNKRTCLMLDEIEAGADRRRAMSDENVNLSKAWMTMRARNIATVATLPSTDTLDKRMLALSDYWVLVRKRGVAQPYKVRVNDFNGKVQRKPIGEGEIVTFPDLPDDDPDKEYLDSIKDDMLWEIAGNESMEKITIKKHKKELEKEVEKKRRELRNEWIREVYNNSEMSQNDIANLDCIDVSQVMVNNILNA